jgi:uncharacterized protein YecE (DUF72 family)
MILVGTSGFQYLEWKGAFYPKTLSTPQMLPYYAGHFPTTEINYTFYRVPATKTLNNWMTLTPDHFRFSFKAPRAITHEHQLVPDDAVVERFMNAIRTMGKKMGIVLFQLPPFLKKDLPRLKAFVETLPPGFKAAFEFREPSWFDDDVLACLKSKNLALCISESEKIASPIVFTAGYGYLRLRREDYTAKDIARWAKVVLGRDEKVEDVYVYFKHEESGGGPKLAKQFMAQTEQAPAMHS